MFLYASRAALQTGHAVRWIPHTPSVRVVHRPQTAIRVSPKHVGSQRYVAQAQEARGHSAWHKPPWIALAHTECVRYTTAEERVYVPLQVEGQKRRGAEGLPIPAASVVYVILPQVQPSLFSVQRFLPYWQKGVHKLAEWRSVECKVLCFLVNAILVLTVCLLALTLLYLLLV